MLNRSVRTELCCLTSDAGWVLSAANAIPERTVRIVPVVLTTHERGDGLVIRCRFGAAEVVGTEEEHFETVLRFGKDPKHALASLEHPIQVYPLLEEPT
ncbi:MAG: hypothetical protein AAFR38_02930 [Planctomycetota bacterium]